MLKATSQINEITQREYIKGYEAHLSVSQKCLPGLVCSEKAFPGFCFRKRTGIYKHRRFVLGALVPCESFWTDRKQLFSGGVGCSAGLPGGVELSIPSTKPCWQCDLFSGCRHVTRWAGGLKQRQPQQMNVGGRWLWGEFKGRMGLSGDLPMKVLLGKAWGKKFELYNDMKNWEREEKRGWGKDDSEEMYRSSNLSGRRRKISKMNVITFVSLPLCFLFSSC